MSNDRLWILLGKKKSGEASLEELAELEQLLADSQQEHGYTHEMLDKLWSTALQTLPETKLSDDTWRNIESKMNTGIGAGKGFVLYLKRAGVAAAVIISFTAVGWFFLRKDNEPAEKFSVSDVKGNMNHISTMKGSKSQMELPDGTKVWLNSNSSLSYDTKSFAVENREVTLQGEAFFDVVKNEKVKFVIHTGTVNITVKGTAFNVKAYPDEKTVETALVRGLVELTTIQEPERKILLKPNEKIIINKNQNTPASVAESGNTVTGAFYTISKLKPDRALLADTAWISPRLEFDDETFEQLAPKLESWFNVHFTFLQEGLKKKRFSAVIEKETLRETLHALQLSFPFSYELKGKDVYIGKQNQ